MNRTYPYIGVAFDVVDIISGSLIVNFPEKGIGIVIKDDRIFNSLDITLYEPNAIIYGVTEAAFDVVDINNLTINNTLDNKMMAFWSNSQYPFILCGTINSTSSDGKVETIEYGHGYKFRPLFILPIDSGLKLKSELGILEKDYIKQLDILKKKSKESVNLLLSDFGYQIS